MRMNKPHIGWEEGLVEETLPEIVVADDRGISKHCVQAPDEPKKLPWLVVGKDGKSDFDKHMLFRVLHPQNEKTRNPTKMLNNRSGCGILCVLLVSGVSALNFGFDKAHPLRMNLLRARLDFRFAAKLLMSMTFAAVAPGRHLRKC